MGACSDGKVVLGGRDLDLARVAVHGYEVAGEATQIVIIHLALRTGANGDHFNASIKMVFDDLTIFLARDHRLL